MSKTRTIFVGLSGGVDSSVAALRLVRAGYTVVGVFIKVWQPDFIACNWEEERLDAMRVAAHLGIPFLTFDAVDAYKQNVADYIIAEYSAGRTPNPDVMCNRHVKFGAFLEFALSKGADAIATGHYARIEKREAQYALLRGIDSSKDQSYFLWTLEQSHLSRILFPVGNSLKLTVREEAQKAGLINFAKRDSQGICFLGEVDMKQFLSHYIQERGGSVLDEQGNVIGAHRGVHYYTIGERHGFTIYARNKAIGPRYVVNKNVEKNTITVSENPALIQNDVITLTNTSFMLPLNTHMCTAQFRYRQTPFPVHVQKDDSQRVKLKIRGGAVDTPSPGQSCVLYDKDVCLGGGIIA